jgi:hypothetical protein
LRRITSSSRVDHDCPTLQHLSVQELAELIDATPLGTRDSTIAFERLVNRMCLSDIAAIVGGDRSNIGWRLRHTIYPKLMTQFLRRSDPAHRTAI